MSRKRQDVSDLRGCAERFRARKKGLVQPTRYAIVRSTTASFAVDVTLETEIVIVRALHIERHRTDRIGWLRAAVLGANDGIVSTASLVVGVAAANAASSDIMVTGVAGLVAGAMSMAAGEYVSVSSQADTEQADIERERKELATDDKFEQEELETIYVKRGLDESLAKQVAEQLMAHDALTTHARDELGISEITTARPIQAAFASAATFAVGAALPMLTVLVTPRGMLISVVVASSILFLALLGAFGAYAGGAPLLRSTLRVTFWGALAMALTAGVGAMFGAVV
jgi:VIT1/CCC1 family predicted Fe2+/Mn2+ transporter